MGLCALCEPGRALAQAQYRDDRRHRTRQSRPRAFRELCRRYGGAATAGRFDVEPLQSELEGGAPTAPDELDEWARCGIERASDIHELFVPHFYSGCEGDDRMNTCAFDAKRTPFGASLGAIYGSDLGHYDFVDMREAAYERGVGKCRARDAHRGQ